MFQVFSQLVDKLRTNINLVLFFLVSQIGKYEDTIGTCFVFSENGELFSIRHLWFKELD